MSANTTINHNLDFYRDLPLISGFSESTITKNHADLPPDWWVVIADVEGSTKAIEQGAYNKGQYGWRGLYCGGGQC